jgi:hypothetical protein
VLRSGRECYRAQCEQQAPPQAQASPWSQAQPRSLQTHFSHGQLVPQQQSAAAFDARSVNPSGAPKAKIEPKNNLVNMINSSTL